jgi:hypothetical protein
MSVCVHVEVINSRFLITIVVVIVEGRHRRMRRIEIQDIAIGILRTLIHDLVHGCLLITRARHYVLVVCRNVTTQHRGCFL